MSTAPDNFQRLRDAGIIRTDDPPQEHRAVIDGLGDDEVNVLLGVWEKLHEADRESGADVQTGDEPKWITYMFF